MSLRLKLAPNAVKTIRSEQRRRFVLCSAVSLAVLLLIGLTLFVCKILLPSQQETRFVTYTETDALPAVQQREVQDLSSKAPVEAPAVEIEVADATSDFAMDSVEMDLANSGDSIGGMDGLGDGDGSGVGEGVGGNGKGGMGSAKNEGSAFCGRFWDFKKTNVGAPSAMADTKGNAAVLQLLSRFYNGKWSELMFSKFYESKLKLYASCFYMPSCQDAEASNAYDPKGKMGLKPSRWVAVYRAKVQAPVSGRFRFVGAADSVMGVRFNGKNVLECGFHKLSTGEWNANVPTEGVECKAVPYPDCGPWNIAFGGFTEGEPFQVEAGKWYDMEVLVSEIGGGEFGFCLLIDYMDAEKKIVEGISCAEVVEAGKVSIDKKRVKAPLYQLFRTSFIEPKAEEIYEGLKFNKGGYSVQDGTGTAPPYDPESPVWLAKPN